MTTIAKGHSLQKAVAGDDDVPHRNWTVEKITRPPRKSFALDRTAQVLPTEKLSH